MESGGNSCDAISVTEYSFVSAGIDKFCTRIR